MNDWSGTMFFLGSFAGAFAFGFPVGPSSLEMLRLDAAGRRVQAWSLAAGVAMADAAWALAALVGLHPGLGVIRSDRKGPIFFLTALMCAFLAWCDKKETGERRLRNEKGNHLPRFWMGALLGASYPLTFGSWVVALAVLRGFGWEVPSGPPWLALFFIVVFLGYFGYLALLRILFARLHGRLPPNQENWLRRLPRYLLLGLAFLFLVLAVAEFLKKL